MLYVLVIGGIMQLPMQIKGKRSQGIHCIFFCALLKPMLFRAPDYAKRTKLYEHPSVTGPATQDLQEISDNANTYHAVCNVS
jgi:hypothetical protein